MRVMFSVQKTQLSHAQKGKKESFTYEYVDSSQRMKQVVTTSVKLAQPESFACACCSS